MYGSSINRISGLVSGLDTDSLVKKLMDAERIPVDKMKQSRQRLMWQSEGYRQWNTDIYSFRNTTVWDMKLSKTYGTFAVSSSSTDKLSGTATAEAVAGTYGFNVNDLAKSAMITGVGVDGSDTTTTNDDGLILDTTKTLNDQGRYSLSALSNLTIKATDKSGTTRTVTIAIDPTKDKIGDVISRINGAKDGSGISLGLQAVYDSNLKQFILRTKDTGASTKIQLSADNTNIFKTLGLTKPSDGTVVGLGIGSGTGASGTPLTSNTASDANVSVTVNGTTSTFTSSTNDVNILGVNYTLKDVGPSTVTVTRDLDAEIKNIKDFVTKYNELLDKLNKTVDETVYRSYQPLTDEQREALSEKQIEQWETKAKSGLFRRDSILSGFINNLRNHMTDSVNNGSDYNSLSAIGISSTSYKDKGKLTIDEDKLRKALQDDPDAVMKLFTQDSDGASSANRGVIQRIYDDFSDVFKKLTDKAGITGNDLDDQSIIGKLIDNSNDRIDEAERRLIDKENAYYRRFTAMETALNKYNSQSSWITQQMGGGM